MTAPPAKDSSARRPSSSLPPRALLLSLTILAAGIHAGCHRAASPAAKAPREAVKVSVISPEWRELPRSVRATGTLFGDEEATIAAKVAGRVIEIARDLGDSAA